MILQLWRPDASASWDEDPLLRMYVVHGGMDALFTTYDHIEVGRSPMSHSLVITGGASTVLLHKA